MRAEHNWFRSLAGSGIFSDLNGPITGELQISLDVRDNVFQDTFTGVTLHATGNGPNPEGWTRASYAGYIFNNLIFDGTNGIALEAENLGSVSPFITYNTIANMSAHGITASAEPGPDGNARVRPKVIGNIFSGNGGVGYQEFTTRTSPSELSNNLFHANAAHYLDNDTDDVINTQSGLNTPIVDGQVVFHSGGDNLVANPLFEAGSFHWEPGVISYEGAHEFFLIQNDGIVSPAVDAGNLTVGEVGLEERSTRVDLAPDQSTADIGFHYKEP